MSFDIPVEINCYLIVGAKLRDNGTHGCNSWVRLTKGKPNTDAGEIAIKLHLELPKALFVRPQLSANICIAGDVAPPEINVELQDEILEAIRGVAGCDVRLIVEGVAE